MKIEHNQPLLGNKFIVNFKRRRITDPLSLISLTERSAQYMIYSMIVTCLYKEPYEDETLTEELQRELLRSMEENNFPNVVNIVKNCGMECSITPVTFDHNTIVVGTPEEELCNDYLEEVRQVRSGLKLLAHSRKNRIH